MTDVDVKQKVLAANSAAADGLRRTFRDSGTLVVNLISSPGSGKTTLLEATARAWKDRYRLGGLDGDIATERDAERLRQAGIPARQILTGGACHLDARQVEKALAEEGERFGALDLLLIENVGNLICPTSYDLGEDFKIALLSVAEGDDKPFKYPGIFSKAAVTVITKSEIVWIFLGAGVLVWVVRAPPTITRSAMRSWAAPLFTWLALDTVDWHRPGQIAAYFAYAGSFIFGSGLAIVPSSMAAASRNTTG